MKGLNILLLAYCGFASAEIYKWKDSDGKIHYSDKAAKSVSATTVKIENINSFTSSNYLPITNALRENNVVMFSASWCGYCKTAKTYFYQHNIKFIEFDVENNASARGYYDSLGEIGVPVILYKKQKLTGFSEDGFKRIYQ